MSGGGGEGAGFNIGSQQAGAIYQSMGDQVIHHGGGQLNINALHAVAELRQAVAHAAPALAPGDHREADQLVVGVEAEMRRAEPDKQRIARALGRVARILDSVGALATSIGTFHQLATWLGAAGAGLIAIL